MCERCVCFKGSSNRCVRCRACAVTAQTSKAPPKPRGTCMTTSVRAQRASRAALVQQPCTAAGWHSQDGDIVNLVAGGVGVDGHADGGAAHALAIEEAGALEMVTCA